MACGVPLGDADREPWLGAMRLLIETRLRAGTSTVLACSALKARYREALKRDSVCFVYLRGDPRTIQARLEARTGHYMKAGLLESQFATLEEPTDAIIVDIDQSVETIVDHIVEYIMEHVASETMENL